VGLRMTAPTHSDMVIDWNMVGLLIGVGVFCVVALVLLLWFGDK
jgi:hypothetical protein